MSPDEKIIIRLVGVDKDGKHKGEPIFRMAFVSKNVTVISETGPLHRIFDHSLRLANPDTVYGVRKVSDKPRGLATWIKNLLGRE